MSFELSLGIYFGGKISGKKLLGMVFLTSVFLRESVLLNEKEIFYGRLKTNRYVFLCACKSESDVHCGLCKSTANLVGYDIHGSQCSFQLEDGTVFFWQRRLFKKKINDICQFLDRHSTLCHSFDILFKLAGFSKSQFHLRISFIISEAEE